VARAAVKQTKLGVRTSCLLHMHASSHSTRFVSALTMLFCEGILLSSEQQHKSFVL